MSYVAKQNNFRRPQKRKDRDMNRDFMHKRDTEAKYSSYDEEVDWSSFHQAKPIFLPTIVL